MGYSDQLALQQMGLGSLEIWVALNFLVNIALHEQLKLARHFNLLRSHLGKLDPLVQNL